MIQLPATLLIGNWKMNLVPSESAAYARQIRESVSKLERTQVWVAPMTISLAHVVEQLRGSIVSVGTQNAHWATAGAYTGETSISSLKDLGLTFTILGHSERRSQFGESSVQVATRMRGALAAGITPVVCIGETESQRELNQTRDILTAQLLPIFEELSPETAQKVIIAYEPVWAIGTGKVASNREIEETHSFIHSLWNSQNFKCQATILYGGSVTPQNFSAIRTIEGVAGALVGGASIKLDQWLELIKISEGSN